MATYTDLMSLFNDIGSAINDKGVNGQHYPYQMASAIRSIPTGISVSGTYSVSSAGTFNIASYESVYVSGVSIKTTQTLNSSTAIVNFNTNRYQGGWVSGGQTGGALALPSTSISTITPASTSQVAVSQYTWTLNDVVVEAIPDSYIIPSGNYTVTKAGDNFDIKQYANLIVPEAANPSVSIGFSASTAKFYATGYAHRGYLSTNKNTGSSFYTLESTSISHITPLSTSQVAVPQYRWTLNEVIVDAMPTPTTLPNINGSAYEAATGDYDFGVTVTIPEGYYSETTINQNFSAVYPSISSNAARASQILNAYKVYDYDGTIVTGTMTNNGKVTATLTSTTTTYTIPAGYHDGTGTVSHITVAIPVPTFSMNSTTGTITASGNWERGFTTNSTYTSTYTLTTRAGATITPTEAQQTAVSAYRWTTGSVLVAAISSTYVGTGIATISSANITVAGQSVTAPAGYYSSAITKAVATMTLPTTFPTTSTGTSIATIGRSTATRYLNIPVGYNTTSRFYRISSVPNGTVTAPTTISSTSATLTAGTNTITLAKTISVTPNVTTAGYISSGTAGNANVALTANITTKSAATYNTSTANQTIASGTYLTGTQTIRAVTTSNLSAANIKAGVTVNVGDSADADRIAGVTGTFTADATATAADIREDETAYVNGQKITGSLHVITYYTGSTVPSDSVGIDGDIYLMD